MLHNTFEEGVPSLGQMNALLVSIVLWYYYGIGSIIVVVVVVVGPPSPK